jgi:Protein of unknown function (DUF1453)
MQTHPFPYSWAIPLVVIAIVMFFRFRSLGKARPLRLERLWIVPALYLALTAFMFFGLRPHGIGWLWVALAFVAGSAIGWQRGRTMKIAVDPETHALNQTSSPIAMLLILALIAVRSGLRTAADVEGLDPILITDCLVVFALGLLSMTRLEMYLRGSRLLSEARGA